MYSLLHTGGIIIMDDLFKALILNFITSIIIGLCTVTFEVNIYYIINLSIGPALCLVHLAYLLC